LAITNSRSQDDDDTYKDQPDAESEPDLDDDDAASSHSGLRRSGRTNGRKVNGTNGSEWKGERRSTRLGAPPETQLDGPPSKRARTVDSATSEEPSTTSTAVSAKDKVTGAAALKSTETAVEQIPGKKRNKFWFYAVEPVDGPEPQPPPSSASSVTNGSGPANDNGEDVYMDDEIVEVPTNGH
jgi:hypothetical protein